MYHSKIICDIRNVFDISPWFLAQSSPSLWNFLSDNSVFFKLWEIPFERTGVYANEVTEMESLSSIKMRLVTWKTKRLRDWKGVGLEIQLYKIQLLNRDLMNFHIANISKCWEGDTAQFHEWQNLLCWGHFWTSPSVHLHLIIIFIIIYFIHIVACEISYIMLHFISLYGNINVFQSFVSSLTNCYG